VRFLIDECLTPRLCALAHEYGHEAYHVAHRGWGRLKDPQLLAKMLAESLVLVTNNRDDFVALIGDAELHPGLIVIVESVRRNEQVAYFATVLDAIGGREDLINTVVEVDGDRTVEVYELPRLR
jgi:predicted nuclease of predicted toxin-antitoxin system